MRRTLNLIAAICTILCAALPTFATAGVGTSGGGHVVVCTGRSADALGYVTLLDLYEAQRVLNLTLRASRVSLEAELELLANQLQVVFGSLNGVAQPISADSLLEWWESRVQYIPGLRTHTSDFGEVPALPVGCALEQIAVYDDKHDVLQVNMNLWDSLDDFNKAALIAHEIIYRERRLTDRESSSQISRFLVGRIFSTLELSDSRTMLVDYRQNH
ncbi:MAG: hypothetical protein ACO3A4_13335 [Silvanigrellaceae bacterium]